VSLLVALEGPVPTGPPVAPPTIVAEAAFELSRAPLGSVGSRAPVGAGAGGRKANTFPKCSDEMARLSVAEG
jgi:hypothetical protein